MNISLNFSGDHEGLDHMQCSKLVLVRSVCDELQTEASHIVRLYIIWIIFTILGRHSCLWSHNEIILILNTGLHSTTCASIEN